MHVGGDYHSVAGSGITSKENLEYNLRYGVKHLTAQVRKRAADGGWDPDELRKMKDDCDRPASRSKPSAWIPITSRCAKGRSAIARSTGSSATSRRLARRRQRHHLSLDRHPHPPQPADPGRGKVTYAGFKLEENWKDLPVGKSGRVSSEDYWERIAYFLEKVIPVAKQYDVRMACHPYDPPGLPFGYQGADNWDSPSIFDAIKRYEAIVDSPYNGFQLCLGTTAEGLKNPQAEILPIVQYLGERGKIYQIHMRNIRGGLGRFRGGLPRRGRDGFLPGDAHPARRAVRRLDLPRSHAAPSRRSGQLQSFAFGYGYIKALIQAVNSEVRA